MDSIFKNNLFCTICEHLFKKRLQTMLSYLIFFTLCVSITTVKEASGVKQSGQEKKELYVAGFFPLSHEEGNTGRGVLPAVHLALEHINNSPILQGYQLDLKYNDTKCNAAVGMKAFFELLFDKRRKVMLFGDACHSVTDPVAKASKFFHLIQISYADTHPMYTAEGYPNLFRVVPSEAAFNPARLALLRRFNWTRVGTIYQNAPRYSLPHSKLTTELEKAKIDIAYTQSVSEEVTANIQKFKENDVRIILGNFGEEWARYIFCQAYKQGIFGRKYQWIIAGKYKESWWNEKDPSMDCTQEELLIALDGYIATDVLPLSSSRKITASGLTAFEYEGAYNQRRKKEYSKYHGYAYDGMWTIAFAIQYVHAKLRARNDKRTLADFDYRISFWAELIREALNQTHFTGVTGTVSYDGNERKGSILLKQFQEGKETKIGEYHSNTGELEINNMSISWRGSTTPPVDRTIKKTVASRVSLTLFIVISVFAVLGIILACVFLTMNIKYRKQRYIKMSSPYLNNLIIIGCILTYTSVIILGLDSRLLSEENFPYICAARAWVLMTGFTLAFGSMFSKTWRVHAIFTNIKLNKKVIKDYKLFMVVAILVFIDVATLTTWQIVDPFFRDTGSGIPEPSPENEDILIVPQMEYCKSKRMPIFLGSIYVYKGLLMAFGCFLAWETRHVSIPALNDSKYIGMSVYNVVIMCVIGAGLSFVLREQQDAAFVIISIFIIFCSTATLCLVFVPKLIELKANPDADDRRVRPTLKPFKKSRRESDDIELHTRIKLLAEVTQRQRQRLKEKTYELEALMFRLRQLGVEERTFNVTDSAAKEEAKEKVEVITVNKGKEDEEGVEKGTRTSLSKMDLKNQIHLIITDKDQESSSLTKSGRETSFLSLSASQSFVSSSSPDDGQLHAHHHHHHQQRSSHISCPELRKATTTATTTTDGRRLSSSTTGEARTASGVVDSGEFNLSSKSERLRAKEKEEGRLWREARRREEALKGKDEEDDEEDDDDGGQGKDDEVEDDDEDSRMSEGGRNRKKTSLVAYVKIEENLSKKRSGVSSGTGNLDVQCRGGAGVSQSKAGGKGPSSNTGFDSDDNSYAKAIKAHADRCPLNGFSSCEEEDTDVCDSTATFSEDTQSRPKPQAMTTTLPTTVISTVGMLMTNTGAINRRRARSLGALQIITSAMSGTMAQVTAAAATRGQGTVSVIGTTSNNTNNTSNSINNQVGHSFLGTSTFPYFYCIPSVNQDPLPNLPIFSSYPSIKCDIVEYL